MSTYLQIMQFVLLGLMFIPAESHTLFKLIPSVWGLKLLKDIMVSNTSIITFSMSDFIFLIVPSLFYLSVGILIFKKALAKAVEKAILGFH